MKILEMFALKYKRTLY